MFLPFVDYGFHCHWLESQSFRNNFITFSRLIDLEHFCFHLFLNFLSSLHNLGLTFEVDLTSDSAFRIGGAVKWDSFKKIPAQDGS